MDRFAPETVVYSARVTQSKSFRACESLKEALSSHTVLAYLALQQSMDRSTKDGCPLGISATLVQRGPGVDDWRVMQYASRSLSGAQRKYSQIELEMLAADFACKKFHVFLYGLPFTTVMDHKPLEPIFNNPRSRHQTSTRLQRMAVRIFDYKFKVEYWPGKTNISDYASRHSLPCENCTKRELGTT